MSNYLDCPSHKRNMASKCYAGLRSELSKEAKLAIRKARSQGKEGWGTVAVKSSVKSRKSVVCPVFSMFTTTDERFARSNARHNEVIGEMILRHELGMSLWANDGDVEADTDEDCVGVELNRSEIDIMSKLIDAVQSTSLASQRK